MSDTKPAPLIDTGTPVFERRTAGLDSVVFCRGMAVASFRQGDAIGRALAIATLLRVGEGLKTDTIAGLCDASHGGVCDVRRRLAEGGFDLVMERTRIGAPRKVVGVSEQHLREMVAAGASVREIAKEIGVSKSLVATEIKRLKLSSVLQQRALPIVAPPTVPEAVKGTPHVAAQPDAGSDAHVTEARPSTPEVSPVLAPEVDGAGETTNDVVTAAIEALQADDEASVDGELEAGAPLASGPAAHSCRYAGTILLCAAAAVLGVFSALDAGNATRPVEAVYDAHQVTAALLAAWGGGYGSLEAMHERDARALGVILGLERSPSVRTLHRAIAQMRARIDVVDLNAALARGVLSARLPERLWFGVDGHFKAYSGDESIDKGWDSKRRLASKGIADVFITDADGFTWATHPVPAGSSLSQHLMETAKMLRGVLGNDRPIVVTFDRGGFDFDVLDAIDSAGFYYVGYVPASVTLPDLAAVAPSEDGVGEVTWKHERLHHPARLIAERDGTALIPVVTNLPTLVDTTTVVRELRDHRGAQENSFKAARAFAHIDRLVDRGGASRAPDDRLVPNPARAALKKDQRQAATRVAELAKETPTVNGRSRTEINDDRLWAEVDRLRIERELRAAPAKVPRVTIEPDAQRAQLRTRNRLLLQPLKLAADNARRWLLGTLGNALAPSDKPHDLDAIGRTLLALLRAPGAVQFADDAVTVTIDLPLPPTPHARLAAGLADLDSRRLLFADGKRQVRFRLAPRPTRADIPGRDPAA
jgi:Helix-turn-helix domain